MFGAFRRPIVNIRTVERKTRVFKGQPCIQTRNRKLRGDDGCIARVESSDMQTAMIADEWTACDYCCRPLLTLSMTEIIIHTTHAGTLAAAQ